LTLNKLDISEIRSTDFGKTGKKMPEISTMNLKSCPRCGGAVRITSDMYGAFKHCLHCGFVKDLPKEDMEMIQNAIAARTGKGRSAA
jgi:hypothetical protein